METNHLAKALEVWATLSEEAKKELEMSKQHFESITPEITLNIGKKYLENVNQLTKLESLKRTS